MKAIVIHQFGNADVLNVEDVSEPTLGAGEIAIKVRAATVNQTRMLRYVLGHTRGDPHCHMCRGRMRPARLQPWRRM